MQISKNKVVAIDYTLTDNDGVVIDTSSGGEPLAYIQGIGNIIPGLEVALEGRKVGDNLKVTIKPDAAYGERDDELVQIVAKSAFGNPEQLEVGVQFEAQHGDHHHVYTVMDIQGDQVTIDGNHPLAGVTLNFDVTVKDVREATAEEMSHGHAHSGAHGHDH